ncbi:DUF4917 domain-containing protein [Klebsiella variicola]|nr:DUF4917 domain-containing protein [Klebsiella variicola]PXL58915.1 DUF4917 domain-containing protein [Klebsiella variicola]
MNLLSFEDALLNSSGHGKRHLLLGNGFSIACRPNIFLYGKLFEQADFSNLSPSIKQVFKELKTEDFEKVISVLSDSEAALRAYTTDVKLLENLRNDALALRELLVQTLAVSHPGWPGELAESEYQHCKSFLENFEKIYTLNYDLLLYWVCMHNEEGEQPIVDDGFRKPEDNYDASYVTWEPDNNRHQNMWFLHGALHLYDAGYEMRKFTWSNTNIRLIDQVRGALKKNYFPIFVSEGKSTEKLEKIRHNDYLAKALRSFSSITGCLFIYGHSLAENDEHILKKIESGTLRQIYVGIYGDPESVMNMKIIKRAERMSLNRSRKNLEVFFFDAESANVWSS